jgi:hypothetical protein
MNEGWALISGLLKPGKAIVMDVKGALPAATKPSGVDVWSL